MNKPHTLSCDLETYSSVDIGKCGVYRYTESDDFEILLFAYSCDYGPVTVIDMTRNDGIPAEIVDWLYDPAVEKTAFNANFERTCLSKWFGRYCDSSQWSCTMILSASCGLPLSLAGVGAALELPEDKAKLKEGKELIRYFCQPCRPTKANGGRTRNRPEDAPEKWATFIEYNRRDVETENTIRQRLLKWRPDFSEQKLWCLDQRMNDKGVRIEPRLAENAIKIGNQYREELIEHCKQLTGLENPNSTAQIKSWLEEQEGIEVLSLNKKAIADVYASLNADQTKEVLKLREEFSKSSNKKYEAFLRCKCKDDHIRGMFQFYGANQTGRWAGRLCQLQNLSHDTLPDLDDARMWAMAGDAEDFEFMYPKVQHALSTLIRTVLIPEENSRFIVCDFSAIEARVLAWIANESWRLEAFENGRDIYCESASKAFKIPVEKHGVNASYRSVGKTLELACIAEDQLVLTDHGLVPIQDVTTEMKVWDGESFVSHDGVVFQGEKFVIAYQGLEATPDHPVFLTGIDEAVPFGWAAIGGWALRDGMYPTDYDLEARYCRYKVKVYDILNAGPNHRYTVSGKLVHNCGYGGGVGAMKNFGADKLGMSEEEMSDAVSKWRDASPHVVALWQSLDEASKRCIKRGKPTISTVGHIRFDIEDGVMWMTLPSGRRIAYWGVGMGQDRWGRPSMTYMSQNQQTKKWERTETYGAKLVENCVSGEAQVITDKGIVCLRDLSSDMLIWDGVEFVSHGGLIEKGVRECVLSNGVAMTPDHKILTRSGWKNAEACDGLDGSFVRLPHSVGPWGRIVRKRQSTQMARTVQVREYKRDRHPGFVKGREKWSPHLVRMYEKKVYRRSNADARYVEASCFCRMALNEAAVYGADTQSLEKLRRPRHKGLRQMAAQFREFLGRHGSNIRRGVGPGSNRQRWRLFARELSMDYAEDKCFEQKKNSSAIGRNTSYGFTRVVRNRIFNSDLSAGPWRSGRITVDKTRRYESVFDIKNCGPRHRFVILTDHGPLIVHNCCQATARDVLKEALFNLDKAGYDVRATVHDEVIITVPNGFGSCEEVEALMCKGAAWTKGLPLNAESYECSSYRKE